MKSAVATRKPGKLDRLLARTALDRLQQVHRQLRNGSVYGLAADLRRLRELCEAMDLGDAFEARLEEAHQAILQAIGELRGELERKL